MNIALPILLLILGGLTFWILVESKVKWYIKTACISTFCLFVIIFWGTIHTFLGWPAKERDVPEKVLVHWVVIKEPNKITGHEGAIYILLESLDEVNLGNITKFFGYKKDGVQPRQFQLQYSRDLHEKMEKLKDKIKNGQPVVGKLTKGAKEGKKGDGKKGNDKTDKKGGGSESQKQEWQFHELLPSEIHRKPEQ